MSLDRLIQMIFNMFLRRIMGRVVNTVVDQGADMLARRKGDDPDRPLTPEEAAQSAAARDMVKRVRKSSRVMRKIGKLPKF